jgi:quinohemoprotein ethanol dehydrogenase
MTNILGNQYFTLNAIRRASLVVALAFCYANVSIAADKEWPHYGGNQWNERHAELSQITKRNVANMVPRHVLQLGQIPYSLSASPLVINGILYVSAGDGLVQAFDLRTGMRKWSFKHDTDPGIKGAVDPAAQALGFTSNCCSNTSRGVAYADGTISWVRSMPRWWQSMQKPVRKNGRCGALS